MSRATSIGAVLVGAIVLTGVLAAQTPKAGPKPNFTGVWAYEPQVTKDNAAVAGMVGGALFTLQFVAEQTDKALAMKFDLGTSIVTAVYTLDGSPSKNTSPPAQANQPPIVVTSTAKWDGATLVINSTSVSPGENGPVEVKSTRKMWLDDQGRVVIERTGTPPGMVTASRSVYSKKQ